MLAVPVSISVRLSTEFHVSPSADSSTRQLRVPSPPLALLPLTSKVNSPGSESNWTIIQSPVVSNFALPFA